MKSCSSKNCTQTNPQSLDQFRSNTRSRDGYDYLCRSCRLLALKLWRQTNLEKVQNYNLQHKSTQLETNRAWRAHNPEKLKLSRRKSSLWALYGLTLVDVEVLLRTQDGACAICKFKFSTNPKNSTQSLQIDHNHNLVKGHPLFIRGLLCNACNTGLGSLGDNISLLQKAADYVQEDFTQLNRKLYLSEVPKVEVPSRLRAKNRKLQYNFGINLKAYDWLLLQQEHKCRLCSRLFDINSTEKKDKPHVDHIHGTSLVRGLLCYNCNFGIGQFKDSSELMIKAINYLNKMVV